MSHEPQYSVQSKHFRIRWAQLDMRQRMQRLDAGEVGDLSDLRFDFHESLFGQTFLFGRILRGEAQVGFMNVETQFWFSKVFLVYGGIALCDGTFIELMISKQRRDVLQAVANGGQDRFELTGLEPSYGMGSRTELRWDRGPLPKAFQAPWLGATDWALPEEMSFFMGKDPLEEHEALPFLLLRGWAWYRGEPRRMARD